MEKNLLNAEEGIPYFDIRDFVRDVFSSIKKEKILEDGTFGSPEPLTSWAHVQDLNVAWRCYCIDRQELVNSSSDYIKNDSLWCKELDWFYTNSLIFAELIATQKEYFSSMLPFTKFIWLLTNSGSFSWKIFLWRIICSLIKWVALLSLGILLFAFNTLFGFLFLSLVAGVIINNTINKRKKLKTLASMVKTYSHTSSINISWRVLREEMDEARKLHGVVWDMEVYKLVDLRLER